MAKLRFSGGFNGKLEEAYKLALLNSTTNWPRLFYMFDKERPNIKRIQMHVNFMTDLLN